MAWRRNYYRRPPPPQAALDAGVGQLCPRADLLAPGGVAAAVAAGLSVRAWAVRDLQVSQGGWGWGGGVGGGRGRGGGPCSGAKLRHPCMTHV